MTPKVASAGKLSPKQATPEPAQHTISTRATAAVCPVSASLQLLLASYLHLNLPLPWPYPAACRNTDAPLASVEMSVAPTHLTANTSIRLAALSSSKGIFLLDYANEAAPGKAPGWTRLWAGHSVIAECNPSWSPLACQIPPHLVHSTPLHIELLARLLATPTRTKLAVCSCPAAVLKLAEGFDKTKVYSDVKWNEEAGMLCACSECGHVELFTVDY